MSSESDDDSFVSTLAQQGGVTLVGKLGGRVFSFLFLMFVTRAVAPEVYGTFTLALAIVSIVQDVFNFNLYQSIDYFLPKALAEGDSRLVTGVIGFVSQVVLLGSTAGVIVIVLLRGQFAVFFDTPLLAPLLGMMALVMLFQSLLNVQEKIFSSLKRMEYRVAISDFGFPVLKLVFVAALVVAGYDAVGLAIGYVSALVVVFFIGVGLLWWRVDEPSLSVQALAQSSFSRKRDLFNYAFPLYLTGIVYAVSGQISYLVLGFFLGPSEVAVYRVAYQLTINLTIVNLAISPIFKPLISSVDDRTKIREQYRLAARWVVLLTVPMITVLIVAPDVYLRLLFSSDYQAATVAVVPLSVGFLFNAFTGPETTLLEGRGYTQITLINSLIMVALNATLLFILVPRYGVFGASIAAGLTLALVPALAAMEIYTFESIHPFSWGQLQFLFAGILAGTVGMGMTRVFVNEIVIAVLLPPVTLFVYLVSIRLCGGFSSHEQQVVEQVDKQLGYDVFERLM